MTDHLYLLAEGAVVTAAIFHTPEPVLRARAAAAQLLAAPQAASSDPALTQPRPAVAH